MLNARYERQDSDLELKMVKHMTANQHSHKTTNKVHCKQMDSVQFIESKSNHVLLSAPGYET